MAYSLGIIGAGNMAEAIVRGILASRELPAEQIIAADISPQRRDVFQKQLAIRTVEDNAEVVKQAKTILLSTKPQQMQQVLEGLRPVLASDTLVISIAAGISTGFIERSLGERRVVRAMPNTPMLVSEGMVAISPGKHATADDLATARRMFQASAQVVEVGEEKMDAVTAVSGSGPAYFFFLVELMVKAGIELGLSADEAHKLATQTALGAAKMLTTSSDSPQELRRKVTSPNGTTHAAITTMEARSVHESIVAAVKRAAERSKELGGK